jgi:ketosteroid isomerase-like protein
VSQENVKAVRRAVDAANRGEPESAFDLLDENVVWEPRRAGIEGAYRGLEGLRKFWADTRENFELFELHLDDVRDLDDRVLTIGRIRVRGIGSGAETEVPVAAIWTFSAGHLVHYKDYGEASLGLEAAGLT